jgi:hypothetical protein
MCDEAFKGRVLERQVEMFRLAAKADWSQARIARNSDFGVTTISSWAKGGSSMDMWAFAKLCEFLPDSLTSIMLEPAGKHVSTGPEHATGDDDIDELFDRASNVVCVIGRARQKKSPGGPAIVPSERADIQDATRDLLTPANRVVRMQKA